MEGTEVSVMKEIDRALEKTQGALGRYCLSLAASRWEAEDLSQDAWLKALESETGLAHTNPEAYLLRIARNAWIDRARQQAARTRTLQTIRSTTTGHAPPDEGLLGIEQALHAVMSVLTPLQNAVWLLRDACDYSAAETAMVLGLSVGAVKAALHRARAALPAVRDAVERGTLPAPKDEGLRDVLRALAVAYGNGDVGEMLAILRQGEADPVPAMAALQSRRLRVTGSAMPRYGAAPSMELAA